MRLQGGSITHHCQVPGNYRLAHHPAHTWRASCKLLGRPFIPAVRRERSGPKRPFRWALVLALWTPRDPKGLMDTAQPSQCGSRRAIPGQMAPGAGKSPGHCPQARQTLAASVLQLWPHPEPQGQEQERG